MNENYNKIVQKMYTDFKDKNRRSVKVINEYKDSFIEIQMMDSIQVARLEKESELYPIRKMKQKLQYDYYCFSNDQKEVVKNILDDLYDQLYETHRLKEYDELIDNMESEEFNQLLSSYEEVD